MTVSDSGAPRRGRTNGAPPDATGRRVTIQDVAQEAGVSVSAVSKVVRDAYGVSPQMRARVTSAIARLGYRPHNAARAMRGRSYTIGVMLVELSSPFQPEVAQGVTEELEGTSYQAIIVAASGADPERQKRAIEALVDRQVDGLILVAPWMEAEWIEELGSRIPTVAVALHGPSKSFDTVVDDDYEGARLLVDHLVGLGHDRIVHTSMPAARSQHPFLLSHVARRDGFERAMRRHGFEADVIETQYSEEGGYDAAVEALARPVRPSAIFAGADIAALGVLRAVEERGLRVPEDLTVAGYDNIYWSTIHRISLTTVDQSGRTTGATSARLLLDRINGRTQPVHYVLAPTLVARSTSGPAPDAAGRRTPPRRARTVARR
jgi:LacI family transcriptional regulator